MRISRRELGMATLATLAARHASAQPAGGAPGGEVPRNETLICENPEGTIKNAGWFNIWAINAGGQSTGLHQLAMDTLWYIDPEQGIDGVWENSLAADKPKYNADYTEMTVKLRDGIAWSDGTPFTADDLVFTIETHMKTPGLRWSAPVSVQVASIEKTDPNTVVFKLKKPNSRFHALFTVRWNAMWMMPKHVFEKAGDPLKFPFNPPVSLGAYTLHGFDPNGKWFTWQKREDWQKTTLAKFGEPGPKYVSYIDPGPPDKRVIAQLNHQLDVIHDTSPEGMFTLVKQAKTSHGWFPNFPYAHPDPTLPAVLFNTQVAPFDNRDLRWALALLIDMKAVALASYRGAATISCIGVPPTGCYPKAYFEPMEAWLQDFTLDTGKRQIKPYDPTVGQQIADMMRPIPRQGNPDRRRCDRELLRAGLVETRSAGRGGIARACGLHEARRQMDGRGRQAARGLARRRGRAAPDDDARRQHDRAAMAAIRHRGDDLRRAGHAERPPRRGRLPGDDRLERRDLGRPPRSLLLPRQLALRFRRRSPARCRRRATTSAGSIPSSTGSSNPSARSISTIPRAWNTGSNTSSSPRRRCRRSR